MNHTRGILDDILPHSVRINDDLWIACIDNQTKLIFAADKMAYLVTVDKDASKNMVQHILDNLDK